MESIIKETTVYSSKSSSLESSETSTIDLISLRRDNETENTGIYTPDSNSDFSDIKLENNDNDTSNPPDNTYSNTFGKWTDEEISILKRQIHADLTSDALQLNLPNKLLVHIGKMIRKLQYQPLWTKKEIDLLVNILLSFPKSSIKEHKHRFPCRSIASLNKKFQHYKALSRKLNSLVDNTWILSEIAILLSLIQYDLTRDRLSKDLPKKSIDEIKSLTDNMKVNSSFSRIESTILEQELIQDKPMEMILNQFPLKDREVFKKELLRLSESPQHKEVIQKRLGELITISQRELKSVRDSIDIDHLKYLISNDLTRKQLHALFPGTSIKHLKAIACEIGFDEGDDYTLPELKILKNTILENGPLKSIIEELPFRSQLSIEKKINEIEPDRRRSVFSNRVDELVYLAKWYSSDTFGNAIGSRRPRKRIQDQIKPQKSYEVNTRNNETKVTEQSHVDIQKQQANISNKGDVIGVQRIQKSKKPSIVDILKEEATYFQTVTGDGHLIRDGEKRKRERRSLTKSESNSKRAKKVKPSEVIKKEQTIGQIKKSNGSTKVIEGEAKENIPDKARAPVDTVIKSENSDTECDYKRSPFDPEDIVNDTLIPLNGRRLYKNEVYGCPPYFPELSFVDDSDVMIQESSTIALSDSVAAEIVYAHFKNYRDMPISFPSLTIMDKNTNKIILNPMNKIRVRFLIYPQHSEMFVLAEPKSNELDPINEIKKLFQLHYALFFSHSSRIKKIILEEYIKEIDFSIEENDFNRFMFVIDKWNYLMIELSPNKIDSCYEDINEEIRAFFLPHEINFPTDEDIRLDIFFSEIIQSNDEPIFPYDDSIEPSSPTFALVESTVTFKPDSQSRLTPPISSEEENEPYIEKILRNNLNQSAMTYTPMKCNKFNKRFVNALKPDNYNEEFIRRLREKTTVSRFCLQQILLRIYSRIVSIESRKLRSYKAFTAEVYGELLPSFTSEVLSKVNLQPHQKFYDLGSGVGNTTFQAALEFGVTSSGGCEIMEHASKLTELQTILLQKHLSLFGLKELNLNFALLQSFVDNEEVRNAVLDCDVLLVNNYLFDVNLNATVGKMLFGLKAGAKIISLRNFIRPRYKVSNEKTIFDYLKVEKSEMSNYLSVSWTANKLPYYISTVQERVCEEYL